MEGELIERVCWFNPGEWRLWRGVWRAGWQRWTALPGDVFWRVRHDIYYVVTGGRPGHVRAIPVTGQFARAMGGIQALTDLRPGEIELPGGHRLIVEDVPLPEDVWSRSR